MLFHQQLKDEFFSTLGAKKGDTEVKVDDVKEDGTTESAPKLKTKPKLQLKRRKGNDDPFASDDEEDADPEVKTSEVTGKPPSKAGGSTKKLPSKAGVATKRIRKESESGSEEDVKPKRRAPTKSK